MNTHTQILPTVFSGACAYRDRFVAGLERLLKQDDLNLFILVCANATADKKLFNRLAPALASRYQHFHESIVKRLRDGSAVQATDDDLLVFLKMVALGWQAINPAQVRHQAGWEIQYNPLRSLRPMRNAASRVESLRRSFDEAGFHFNKAFIQQEAIWQGELLGTPVDLYYNKFPFAELHALLVPERTANRPQYLTAGMHRYIWSVTELGGHKMPGLRIAYNAFGAFASVNHLHFQLCVRAVDLPIESARWTHNGGAQDYPLCCHVFTDPEPAWTFIAGLHAQDQTYNLLYSPGKLYCLPRARQGEAPQPEWSPGLSWYELCGGFITFNQTIYNNLTANQLADTLSAIAI